MSIFARFDRHAGLMDRMASTLSIDLAEESMAARLTPSDYRNAVFRCIGCTYPAACSEWVDSHPGGAARAPDFCRNMGWFERLART